MEPVISNLTDRLYPYLIILFIMYILVIILVISILIIILNKKKNNLFLLIIMKYSRKIFNETEYFYFVFKNYIKVQV